MLVSEIIDDLIEVKEMLESLQNEYNIPDIDPLWADPMDKLTTILEENE